MNSIRIALIEASSGIGGCYTYAGHNEFEPLALEYIAAVIHAAGYETNIFRQGQMTPEDCAREMLQFDPSVIGLSVMTHAANAAGRIATLCKQKRRDIITVAGGYHPSGDIEYAQTSGIDYVVLGEGEEIFLNLLRCLEAGNDPHSVPGIRFARGNEIITTPRAARIRNLDALPSPLREERFLAPARMHGLMLPSPRKQHNVAMVLGSRGCVNNCSFCCNQAVWGQKVVTRIPQKVAAEITELVKRFQTNAFFFSDLTFNASRTHLIKLCAELQKHKHIPPWYAMCTTAHLTKDEIEAMHAAGCRKIWFGIESMSFESLSKIGKGVPLAIDGMRAVLEMCDEIGVLTKAYLIIGYPWDSHDSLKQFQNDILTLPADEIRISYFTPFPGSPSYEAYRSRLLTNDWSRFNAITDAVVRNERGLTPDDLQKIRKDAFRTFYSSQKYNSRVTAKLSNFPEFEESFAEFRDFLRQGNVISTDNVSAQLLLR